MEKGSKEVREEGRKEGSERRKGEKLKTLLLRYTQCVSL